MQSRSIIPKTPKSQISLPNLTFGKKQRIFNQFSTIFIWKSNKNIFVNNFLKKKIYENVTCKTFPSVTRIYEININIFTNSCNSATQMCTGDQIIFVKIRNKKKLKGKATELLNSRNPRKWKEIKQLLELLFGDIVIFQH